MVKDSGSNVWKEAVASVGGVKTMAFITDPYVFFASVALISMSGVLMPGPLFAVTIEKAAKSKTAGALIAVGHGIVEFPLMFLIFFVLSQFEHSRFRADFSRIGRRLADDFHGHSNFQE